MTKYLNRINRPENVDTLQQNIRQAWEEITPELCRSLVASMPRRLQSVLDKNGEMSKY
jgi:hypothetical protein